MKIVVTGANGQLGKEIQAFQNSYPKAQIHFFTKEDLNIADLENVKLIFNQLHPDYCINCAAYTAVDKAETERETAFLINETGTKNLALVSSQFGTKFIHISTDYVFDGNGSDPYKEEHPVDPQNIYGLSKLRGEEGALAVNTESIIIRTAWVYSEYGNNFVKTMLRLLQSKEEISVVADQLGSPTYAADLAKAILSIIDSGKWVPGIYHYSNDGIISWFEFANAIQQYIQSKCRVNAIPTSAFPTPAKRPAYSVLNKEKIKTTFGLTIPDWETSLHHCLDRLKEVGAW
ncbi:dTDP-4-dehydrorhamnose reductase [Flavisolibacter tropicus]|uniref:dTDP-4-dehydrorhamnose reductase n=1 Tax=Flavisolibacter tropicus TaxID=1492898 RepID=A0A172TTC8_9BACT|nr:dTDP-4-dehydrorhamnose reductase [Flavisolibacter tropicus]ANE50252.1 dTDP-4-dehydrorhamnose reductase [Flavisolibacter tropicus]